MPCLHGAHTKPFGTSTLAILGPKLANSSVITSQNSSDLVSYAI
jgi:hypothetical protein